MCNPNSHLLCHNFLMFNLLPAHDLAQYLSSNCILTMTLDPFRFYFEAWINLEDSNLRLLCFFFFFHRLNRMNCFRLHGQKKRMSWMSLLLPAIPLTANKFIEPHLHSRCRDARHHSFPYGASCWVSTPDEPARKIKYISVLISWQSRRVSLVFATRIIRKTKK